MGSCTIFQIPDVSSATVVLVSSLAGMPICMICNWCQEYLQQTTVFLIGCICLSLLVAVIHIFRDRSKPFNALYYVFGICCFSSVIDLVIALENDGVIKGFVEFYLRNGEPYLKTAHGTMICYWDGTVHYGMYLTMLLAMSWGQSYRSVGLAWSGSIINSLIVLLLGNVLGDHSIKLSFLLNTPFVVVPIYAIIRFLWEKESEIVLSKEEVKQFHTSLWKRPIDILCVCFCIAAIFISLFRGCIALSSTGSIFSAYVDVIEPYIKSPGLYPTIQMMTYMYYFVPFYAICIYGLCKPGQSWMSELTLIFAGAIGQGQFSYTGAALHKSTPVQYRVPETVTAQTTFLVVNLLPVICGALLVYRCSFTPNYFIAKSPVVYSTALETAKHQQARVRKRS